ncbi:archaetidylserine decarboxylase [Guyparkeria hydrothermalis]|uniref:archaetidylserine decarboxylase n=1 Tax=Guyparkeria hydrothermalis TaxID=923 RepID=UPI00201FC58F|nr:archaetidylserine decarboxylase [Guyparkeria hydrothermalis]MCL7743487.1 archaetidylserine decarboxylase [Guyparkeria hydrothermalis]
MASATNTVKWQSRLWARLQYVLPHHLISGVVFRVTRWRAPWTTWLIRRFVRAFGVNLDEAAQPDPTAYETFNAFFTRPLADGARPIEGEAGDWVSPVDGGISQIGHIQSGNIFQAKGHAYTATDLLGGDAELAEQFKDGSFATLYLSPSDYHRIHMPVDGTLREMIHVPGRLFSVSTGTVAEVPRLFARNERLVCLFDTADGPMAMVLVGAINVSAIETVWAGLVTPSPQRQVGRWAYRDEDGLSIRLKRGAEMGRFNMGSTVILLTAPGVDFDPRWQTEMPIKLGERLQATSAQD